MKQLLLGYVDYELSSITEKMIRFIYQKYNLKGKRLTIRLIAYNHLGKREVETPKLIIVALINTIWCILSLLYLQPYNRDVKAE